jgi:hypothetical protein
VLLLRLLLALGIVDTSGKFTVHVCRLQNTWNGSLMPILQAKM